MTASELPNGQIPAASSETNENNNNNTTTSIETNINNPVNDTTTEQTTTEPDLHELQTEWSLWLYTNNKSRKWEENLQHVISFKSVEEFWAVYNHIQLSSKLTPGHDYALFRAGTRPAWEDEANKTGGRWMLQLPAKQHRATNLDRLCERYKNERKKIIKSSGNWFRTKKWKAKFSIYIIYFNRKFLNNRYKNLQSPDIVHNLSSLALILQACFW